MQRRCDWSSPYGKTIQSTYPHDILCATISYFIFFFSSYRRSCVDSAEKSHSSPLSPSRQIVVHLLSVSDALLRLDLGGRGVCMLCGSMYEANRIAQCGDYCAR